MGLHVNIQKNIGKFSLDVALESDAKRIGIFGASGAGKTTMLKTIAGIEEPDSGVIEINGKVLFNSKNRIDVTPQKRNVGYMFQNYALFPVMTVEENIGAALKCNGTQKRERVAEMITRFKLDGLEKNIPSQLSGGQQQRVALARIMIYKPELILLDEPFSALDANLKENMQLELIRLLEDYEGQVVMVSHSRDELYRFSDKMYEMKNGQIGEAMDFTHFDEKGNAVMVDVTDKDVTERVAIAEGTITVNRDAMDAILSHKVKKGDVLTVAQVAGIMGTKQTANLIPMCHPLALTNSKVEFEIDDVACKLTARCTVKLTGKTGVEMEALTGVSVALLTVYDMCKAIDKHMVMSDIHLVEKSGGKSSWL